MNCSNVHILKFVLINYSAFTYTLTYSIAKIKMEILDGKKAVPLPSMKNNSLQKSLVFDRDEMSVQFSEFRPLIRFRGRCMGEI